MISSEGGFRGRMVYHTLIKRPNLRLGDIGWILLVQFSVA